MYRYAQVALILRKLDAATAIPDQRLYDCVNVILSLQNQGQGWATYENMRSYPWLEVCNHVLEFRVHKGRLAASGHALSCR